MRPEQITSGDRRRAFEILVSAVDQLSAIHRQSVRRRPRRRFMQRRGRRNFAKFGEKTSERARQANAHYLIGLGQFGLEEQANAKAAFQQALDLHPAHLGAVIHASQH